MKKIITYSLRDKGNKERCSIVQKLFGYNDKSNKGQYVYRRKGLLDEIDYEKELMNVISVKGKKDQGKVVRILEKLGVKVSFRSV